MQNLVEPTTATTPAAEENSPPPVKGSSEDDALVVKHSIKIHNHKSFIQTVTSKMTKILCECAEETRAPIVNYCISTMIEKL
jgi:hypothetical protein